MIYNNIYSSIINKTLTPIIIINDYYEILQLNLCAKRLLQKLDLTIDNFLIIMKDELALLLKNKLDSHSLEKSFNACEEKLYLRLRFDNFYDNITNSNIISIAIDDITKEKKTQLELEEIQEQFRLILDNMPVMIYATNKDGKLVLWNKECEKVTGYSSEEILSVADPYEVLYPDKVYREILVDKCKNQNFIYKGIEADVACKDGSVKTISLYSSYQTSPISDWLYIKFGMDITQRKLIEKSLREKTVEFETIFKAFPDIYFRFDKNGTFLDCKCENSSDLILSPDELVGKNIDKFSPLSTGMEFKSSIIKSLKTKSLVVFEYELSLKKGRQYYEARLIPISDNEVVAIIRNITLRKQSDEELLKLEKLNSIGTLAGGVAHDFNNILTIILGNISLLKTYVDSNNKIAKKLLDLERTVFQAKTLTKQLLTFSKGSTLFKKTTYINDLIKETITLALSGSNVACKLNIPDDLWPIEADSGQISQVINNLIINAYQAMPNGGLIHISCKNIHLLDNEIVGLSEGNYVNINIKDQGCGINKENLLKIFDPYFTTKETGSGLGLASAYSIIKKHNGHILVKSKISKGSIFQIYIPACQAVPLEIEEAKHSLIHGNNKILIMDDELNIRKVLSAMLKHLGYKVEISKDGSEAIESYKKAILSGSPFDAVIMDLTIPGGMGGEETIKHLLKIDPNIKAIVSSGYSAGGVTSNFSSYGFKGAINKPYTLEELSYELNRVLGTSSSLQFKI